MIKIGLIQRELKDSDFVNGGEKVNFDILRALCDSGFCVDVFCAVNNMKKKYNINNIMQLPGDNFSENALSVAENLHYDLTFATDYIPADIVYLHQHTRAYREFIVKSKMEALFSTLFNRKNQANSAAELNKQKKVIEKNKIILTPSTMLKNDLINMLHVDGQKIYLLPPAVSMPKKVTTKLNKIFTFGFIGSDFADKGGYILLKAIANLCDFDFKVKIIYPYEKISPLIKFYLKCFNLYSKVEFLPQQDDITSFYADIDCLLVPSKRETFGLSVLESMSMGKIVVISSRCGAKDIIEPDNNGFIFDITKNAVVNLSRVMRYIIVNKDDFENLRQKAMFTASVYNFEKFKLELARIINKYAQNSEDI